MAATFALSWYRNSYWANMLRKPAGRAISDHLSADFEQVEKAAQHINKLDPQMACAVEVFR